jgi:putative PIN family toxin of toxin-antitoxin system
MRVILDTNVLLSALIRWNSVPGRILDAWFDDRFILITHELQLEELRVVTRRQQIRALIRPSEAGRLVNQLRANAELITQLPHTRRSDDPADDFLLALSEAGRADHLVTGDKAGLLRLSSHYGILIQTARDFLDRLTGK